MRSNSAGAPFQPKIIALFVFVVLLILYGSLYPWQFELLRDTDPLRTLLHSWDFELNRFALRDMGINILLYMPLGFTAYLVFRRSGHAVSGVIPSVLMGLALSCLVEMVQAYEPGRETSLVDVLTNVIGSAAGALGGVFFQQHAGVFDVRARGRKKSDASALLLLAIFAAWLTFPFFPIPGRTALSTKISVVAHGPVLDPRLIVTALICWYAAGLMIRGARLRPPGLWAAMSLVPLFAEFLIIHREPWIATMIGAALGASLAAVLPAWPLVGGLALLLLIVMRGLAPFHFSPFSQAFLWIPFGGFLAMDWEQGLLLILEKVFFYGAAIWLLRAAGLRLLRATTLVAVILAAIEAIQTRVPPHTPEITDPLLAMLLGFGIGALSPCRETGKQFQSRG